MASYELKAFSRTVGTTAERLQNTSTAARLVQSCVVYAPSSNSGTVYIGGSTVDSTDGFPIPAGASFNLGDILSASNRQEFDIHNVWIVGSGAGQVVKVIHEVQTNA